jgi:anti-sigma factor RsiW
MNMSAQMIDHQDAVKSLMAERYLLGELKAGEREAYEEHLFSCDACFEQVKAGTEFVGHLRRIGIEEAEERSSWSRLVHLVFRPSPALAFAIMFLCTAGIGVRQAVIIHQMDAPESVIVLTVPPPARALTNPLIAPRRGNFELRTVFPHNAKLQSYTARVVSASGKEAASAAIKQPWAGEVQVRVNAGSFRDGNYTLIVQAIDQATGSPQLVVQQSFKLQLQD